MKDAPHARNAHELLRDYCEDIEHATTIVERVYERAKELAVIPPFDSARFGREVRGVVTDAIQLFPKAVVRDVAVYREVLEERAACQRKRNALFRNARKGNGEPDPAALARIDAERAAAGERVKEVQKRLGVWERVYTELVRYGMHLEGLYALKHDTPLQERIDDLYVRKAVDEPLVDIRVDTTEPFFDVVYVEEDNFNVALGDIQAVEFERSGIVAVREEPGVSAETLARRVRHERAHAVFGLFAKHAHLHAVLRDDIRRFLDDEHAGVFDAKEYVDALQHELIADFPFQHEQHFTNDEVADEPDLLLRYMTSYATAGTEVWRYTDSSRRMRKQYAGNPLLVQKLEATELTVKRMFTDAVHVVERVSEKIHQLPEGEQERAVQRVMIQMGMFPPSRYARVFAWVYQL